MNDDSIKIMSLLDELEELIASSGKMPFSEKGIIDLDVAQKIIEDMRLNLPRDIQQAKWLGQEKDRIISDAKREYNRMINEAKDQVSISSTTTASTRMHRRELMLFSRRQRTTPTT
jgi:hypothetical protein